jgi:predicted phosphoribosyltransferase
MDIFFHDRIDAGRKLAARLVRFRRDPRALVLALPRGGVPVAAEVSKALEIPFDLFIVRKLGFPDHEELAAGAIASGGITVFNQELAAKIPKAELATLIRKETAELERRERHYRGKAALPDLNGRNIIVIDDGIATGATMRAAVTALKMLHPAQLIVAVPVAPPETCAELDDMVDEVVCLSTPELFGSVGSWYANFSQTSDDDVLELMKRRRGAADVDESCGRQRPM